MEKRVERAYIKLANNIEREMGGPEHYVWSNNLTREGEKLLGNDFVGVYAKEQYPFEKMTIRSVGLINTKDSTEKGEHWCGVGRLDDGTIAIYDSYGRKSDRLFGKGFVDSDLDVEQSVEEINCGPRCLSWCYIFHHRPDLAILI